MTNNLAAITALTYDDESLQTDPIGLHLELVRGINEIPAVRGEDDTVSALPGRVAYPRLADILPLELAGVALGSGSVVADQQSDYRTLMGVVRELLARGSLNPLVLAGTLEDGSTATINARVVDYQVTETMASISAEIRVALESVDPDWIIVPPV
jgi:hypothetical protein